MSKRAFVVEHCGDYLVKTIDTRTGKIHLTDTFTDKIEALKKMELVNYIMIKCEKYSRIRNKYLDKSPRVC